MFRIALLILLPLCVSAQKQVAITIDDAPKGYLGKSILLKKIDSLNIPAATFINEHLLYKNDSILAKSILDDWAKNPLITLANHSYSHARASKSSYNEYKSEIIDGEKLTRKLCEKYNKELKHFRFPYNDLGKDSLQQDSLKSLLNSLGYRISPFTIESSDWMFNSVYKHYLEENKLNDAKRIANGYINYTLQMFDFFDSVAYSQYNKHIKHIYLCHDNELNRDYLDVLCQKLKEKNYSFISFDQALTDPVYQQVNHYHKKYGITWIYRWMSNHKDRVALMYKEPTIKWFEKEYEEFNK